MVDRGGAGVGTGEVRSAVQSELAQMLLWVTVV